MAKRPFLTASDIILLLVTGGLILFGVGYAAITDVIHVPGVSADQVRPSVTVSPAAAKIAPRVSPSTSANAEAVVVSPQSSASPSLTPAQEMANRDQARKSDLANLQVALAAYYKKHKQYPIAASYDVGRTDLSTTALKVLVTEGYLTVLPADTKVPDYWYGYLSGDGKNYSLSARLENATDPAGKRVGSAYLYIVNNNL